MSTRSKWIVAVVFAALPVVVVTTWLTSGRETFTKSGKAIDVPVQDIFGEIQMQKQFAPGPIAGYYVGLDLVAASFLFALLGEALLLISSWLNRRRARRLEHSSGQPAHELCFSRLRAVRPAPLELR